MLHWVLAILVTLASLGVVLLKKPVYASLSFLATLLLLSIMYLQLSAEFIAVMQVLVYAGAILVVFMFVMVLFQDAHEQIEKHASRSSKNLLIAASTVFLLGFAFLIKHLVDLSAVKKELPNGFGTVESLGKALYIDFFFPFEAVILLFLVAVIGALYIGKRV